MEAAERGLVRDSAPCAQEGRPQGFREKDSLDDWLPRLGGHLPVRKSAAKVSTTAFILGDLEEKRGLYEQVGLWHGGALCSPTQSRQGKRRKVTERRPHISRAPAWGRV